MEIRVDIQAEYKRLRPEDKKKVDRVVEGRSRATMEYEKVRRVLEETLEIKIDPDSSLYNLTAVVRQIQDIKGDHPITGQYPSKYDDPSVKKASQSFFGYGNEN